MDKLFVNFLPPWVETNIQPAFYDKESGSVLQQTARMYAKVNCLVRMFNKLSKETKETVEDYIARFVALKDFVDTYFENLDVQEEINNKLDAMVEDGTLQEIITTYIQSNVAWTFDNVAEMQSATNLIAGSFAQTYGFYSLNDGGGAKYIIRNPDENETANNITTFEVGELIAELSPENEVSIRQGGAKSVSDFDNSTIINTLLTNFKNVYIPRGTFECNGITIKSGNVLRGSGTVTSILKNNSENGTVITNDNNITAGATIKNFAIDGNENSADYGIYLDYFTHSSSVENVKVNKCATGCYVTKSWYAQFVNLDIAQCGRGIEINDNSHEINGIQFVDCYINNTTTDYGIYVKTSSHIVNALNIVSCTIENTESHGIFFDSPNHDRIRNVKVDSCYFEGNKGNCIDGRGKDLAIENCYFHPKSTSQIIINSQFSALNVNNCFEEADVIPSYSIYHTGGLLFCFGYVTNASNKIHVEDNCKAYINSIGIERINNATLVAPKLYKNTGYGTATSDSMTLGINDTAVDNGAPYEYKLGYDYASSWFGTAFKLKTSIKGGSTTDLLSVGGRTPKIKVSNSTLIELPKGETKPTDNISSGCLFFDTTSNKLCYYNGSAWIEL